MSVSYKMQAENIHHRLISHRNSIVPIFSPLAQTSREKIEQERRKWIDNHIIRKEDNSIIIVMWLQTLFIDYKLLKDANRGKERDNYCFMISLPSRYSIHSR